MATMEIWPRPSLDEIAAALDCSEADILAGDVVSADEVDRIIQERIDRTEARLSAARPHRVASPHG
jgi:hypothetical protein